MYMYMDGLYVCLYVYRPPICGRPEDVFKLKGWLSSNVTRCPLPGATVSPPTPPPFPRPCVAQLATLGHGSQSSPLQRAVGGWGVVWCGNGSC